MSKATLKQPSGLYLLFFSELWERFGFYTVQILLVLYMIQKLQIPEAQANYLYGAYSSLLYLTPVIGGMIADRYLGYQKAVIWGAVFFIIGYFLATYPSEVTFFWGLSFLVLGNGLFKPNVSSLVGRLYKQDDPRKDAGFTLFYLGINIGGLLPTIFTGYIVKYYNWNMAFLFAAIGLCLSLTVFLLKKPILHKAGLPPEASPLNHKSKSRFYWIFFIGAFFVVLASRALLLVPRMTDLAMILAFALYVIFILYLTVKRKIDERKRMIAALILIVLSIGFWSVYNLTFSSLMLFSERVVDRNLFGWNFPTQFTQFFNPFFILVLSPFLSQFWLWTESKTNHPLTPLKFSFGILFVALGFYFLGAGVLVFSPEKVSAWWLVGSYFIQTLGELFLSPIALAMITRLCPKEVTGMMMGFWFMMIAVSFSFAGELGTLVDTSKNVAFSLAKQTFGQGFLIYGTIALGFACVAFACIPLLKRLIHNTHLE